MELKTIGNDLAKAVMQVHGVDKRGKAALKIKKQLRRDQMLPFFANLKPWLEWRRAPAPIIGHASSRQWATP